MRIFLPFLHRLELPWVVRAIDPKKGQLVKKACPHFLEGCGVAAMLSVASGRLRRDHGEEFAAVFAIRFRAFRAGPAAPWDLPMKLSSGRNKKEDAGGPSPELS